MIDPQLRDEGPSMSPSMLRQFAGLWLAFLGGLAVFHGVWGGRPTLAKVLAVIALGPGLAGLIRPGSIRWLFKLAMAIATPIGLVVSTVLLAVIFYVVITPFSWVFKMMRRDALARRLDPTLKSHWVEREQVTDPRRYWHQS
jgi:hypothetical protein